MKKLILLLILVGTAGVYSQVGQQWVTRYNGPVQGLDQPSKMVLDYAGNLYITGKSYGSDFTLDYCTIKYNPSGVQQWVSRYDGPANDTDYATGIAIDVSGNVYVTGGSKGNGTGFDVATVKYNNAGVQQWAVRYNCTTHGKDYATAIGIDASGNIYVTGASDSTGSSTDFITIKYTVSGAVSWIRRYNNSPVNGIDVANCIGVNSSGLVYVGGYSQSPNLAYDGCVVRYNSSGSQLWVSRINSVGSGSDFIYDGIMDNTGNFCVTGVFAETWSLASKINGTGNILWVDYRQFSYGCYGKTITIDDSDNVFVCAQTRTNNYRGHIDTYKLNSAGELQFASHYYSQTNGVYHDAHSNTTDNFGNVYVTGEWQSSNGTKDIITIKYNNIGAEQWIRTYSFGGNVDDIGYSVKVGNCNNIHVTGMSGFDYVTIQYSQIIPPPPVLVAPPNNSTGHPVIVTLRWFKSQCAANYRVQLATDSTFTNPIVNDSTLTDTVKAITGLNYNTIYYWRVNAKNASGTSSYSAVWRFTTNIAPPPPPVLIAPPNNSTGQGLTPLLDWDTLTTANTYRVQVSTDVNFTTTVLDSSNILIARHQVAPSLLNNNVLYYWRVNATNAGGTGPWSAIWNFRTTLVGIQQIGNEIPKEFKLYNSYPNPFNPTTKIKFDIPSNGKHKTANVKLVVYNILGQAISKLVNEELQPGRYEINFDGSNLASGMYFYRIEAGEFIDVKKTVLMK